MENENACYIETRGNSNGFWWEKYLSLFLTSQTRLKKKIRVKFNFLHRYVYMNIKWFTIIFSVNETEIEFRGCTQISEHDKKYNCNNEAKMDKGNGIRICYCFNDDCNK